MTLEPFIPFGSSDDEIRDLHVLREGVPPDLLEHLVAWVYEVIVEFEMVRMPLVLAAQTAVGVDLGARGSQYLHWERFQLTYRSLSALSQLRVVDFLASGLKARGQVKLAESLWAALELGRSYVTLDVSNEEWRLRLRVPEGVRLAVEATIAGSGDAGAQLAKAWAYLHDLTPNPSEAMTWAVKAVETATIPVIVPSQTKATLGHVLGQLRKEPGRTLVLRQDNEKPDHHAMLVAMIESLWVGHQDRHGATVPVTLEQARTSVHLAATLVAWFSLGCVTGP